MTTALTPGLRPMRWWDITAVMPLEHELFGEESWTEAMLWSELAEPDTRFYVVAEEDEGVAGYAGLCVYSRTEAYVQTIGVALHAQHRGIGTRLLQALLDEADRRGCPRVDLEVRADNEGAQALYRRHGFQSIGLRRGYYQPSNTDAVIMRREREVTG